MIAPIRNQFVLSSGFRPMLAATCKDINDIVFPVLATPKIDGIRCITREKQIIELINPISVEAVSRSLLPIRNRHIQATLGSYNLPGLDGELITWTNGKMDEFCDVDSKVMSEAGVPEFTYHVFDIVEPLPYWDRMAWLKDKLIFPQNTVLRKVLPRLIETKEEMLAYEQACLLEGFEGVMYRSIDSPYKFGRSTFKQGWLVKLKRFEDAEATVIGFEELMRNNNEAETNELGLTERSSHSVNMSPGNTLGALIVCGHNGVTFNIGSGLGDRLRAIIWANKENYLHKRVKYKYQPHGTKDKPRSPIFLGFRSDDDTSE